MYKVAVVEDQQFIANAIADMIRRSSDDYDIYGVFYDGQEFVDNTGECPPDIVVTDIRMPGMDGIELSRWLREYCPEVKIILLSGYEDFQYAREAISLGVSNYLLKPCLAEEMLKALEDVVEKIRAERKNNDIIKKYETQFIDNLPTLKQQALIAAMFTDDMQVHPNKLGLGYLLKNSKFYLIDAGMRGEEYSTQEGELYLFCCENMLEELLASVKEKEFFICNGQFVLITPVDEVLSEKTKICLQSACAKVEAVVHKKVCFYEGGIIKSVEDCRHAYRTALDKSKENSVFQMKECQKVEKKNVLEQAIQYVREHYREDISLQDVADITYVSYNYLSSLFTQNLGVNFSVYLSRIRIENACELLKHGENRVAEVAEKVGYNNYRYFNYVFKKMTGYTPSEYRRLK